MTKIGSYVIFSSVAFLLMRVWPSALGQTFRWKCELSKDRCEKCKADNSGKDGHFRCVPKKDDGISTNHWCCAEDRKPSCNNYSECKKNCNGTECSFHDPSPWGWPCWNCDDRSKGEKWDKGKCGLSKKKCDECAADKGVDYDLHCVKEDERSSSWCCAQDKKPGDCQNYDECKKNCKGHCEFNFKETKGWPCWKCVEPKRDDTTSLIGAAIAFFVALAIVFIVLPIVLCFCYPRCPGYSRYHRPYGYGHGPIMPGAMPMHM